MVDELTPIKHTEECWAYVWHTLNIVFVVVVQPFESLLLLLFSQSVVSNSLLPHWLYHSRLPCLSLSPVVCSNSCPLSPWCHPTTSSLSPPPPAYSTAGKDPGVGKDWGQEGKWTTEGETVGCHPWLNGHELCKLLEIVKDRKAWCATKSIGSQRVRHNWATTSTYIGLQYFGLCGTKQHGIPGTQT